MKKNDLYSFIFFGTSFRFLQDVRGGFQYHGEGLVRENIETVLNFLNDNQMNVSKNAAWRLLEIGRKWDEKFSLADENTISESEAEYLAELVNELRATVLAEAHEVTAFFPSEKRYNVRDLYDHPENIFGTKSFNLFPGQAQNDFSEACKCIMLERGTAAAFHLMRGCEGILKHLYFSVVKRGRCNPAMWGNMVQHLEKRDALDEACKGMLDIFRKGFRNPTAHPDRVYSVDEAQDLLGTTIQLAALMTTQAGYEPPER